MDLGTTSTAVGIINKTGEIYEKKGFESASGYIIVILAILVVIGMFFYLKSQMKSHEKDKELNREQNKEERKQYKEIMDTMISSFIDTNKQIVGEIKTISERQDKLVSSFNSSIEGLYDVVAVHTKEIKKELNTDKELSMLEFEKQYKTISENCIFKIRDSLDSRIDRNMIFENKESICGIGNGRKLEDSEIYSLIKKHVSESRDKVKGLNYKNDNLKHKLFKNTDEMSRVMALEICYIFDVGPEYIKATLYRGVRNACFKALNQINEINFENIM